MKGEALTSDAGFAVLDAMIAAVLAGVTAAALLAVVTQSLRADTRSEQELASWAWAQALVETASRADEPLERRSGVTPDGAFEWTLTLEVQSDQAFEIAVAEVRARSSHDMVARLEARRRRR
jgi:Tfp pilus assembly protein PilV